MRPLSVGIQLPEVEWEVPFPELIRMAQAAEAVGFDSIWLGDHLLYDFPNGPRGPWEVWTSLAAIAASTSTILLGPLVASTSFHAPQMLAKQASTVDAISAGRLVLGLGAGWNEREYRAFGFPHDHRVSRFAEAFTIIRRLMAGERFDFVGDYYQAEDCVLHPVPARPVPLMVGSNSPRMLSITLPYVQSWNVWWSLYGNTVAGFAAAKAAVDAQLATVERSASDVEATCAVYVQMPDGKGRRNGHDRGETQPLSGAPAALADQLRGFAAAGASAVQLVVDPITRESIEALGPMLAYLDQ